MIYLDFTDLKKISPIRYCDYSLSVLFFNAVHEVATLSQTDFEDWLQENEVYVFELPFLEICGRKRANKFDLRAKMCNC